MESRPERAFRIADRRFPPFDGFGAFQYGGRWNSPGHSVIYAAETYPGALLESLVYLGRAQVPKPQVWIEVPIPPTIRIEYVPALQGWDDTGSKAARAFGDRWHQERRSLVLVVPSLAAAGQARNIIFNQEHPDFAQLKPSQAKPVNWDERLFR
ncbi:MAG: RES domain-containing protein [Bryobacterales bacterium]|nr:RES domain-containing protein [Bryobacterales bacterium]